MILLICGLAVKALYRKFLMPREIVVPIYPCGDDEVLKKIVKDQNNIFNIYFSERNSVKNKQLSV